MSNKTIVKLGIFCAVLVALKWLWESDTALNAIILFGTAGVVPGTSVVLSPQQVYIVLSVVLGVSVFALFGKNIVRSVRQTRANWIARHEELLETSVVDIPLETVAVHEPKPVVVITLPAQPAPITKLWRRVRPQLLIALGTCLELSVEGVAKLSIVLRRISLQVYRYSVRLWMWAEPHIRRFDKQLETMLKRNKDIAAALHVGSMAVKFVRDSISTVRNRLDARFNRLPED